MASCLVLDPTQPVLYLGEFFAGIAENPVGVGNWTGKRLGPRVTVLDTGGDILARVGDQPIGPEPGSFYAPHGIAVDSKGDLYVAEVSLSAYGRSRGVTEGLRSFQKLVRQR